MTQPAKNEGFRMLDDFVCEAIPASEVPSSHPKKPGRNEGMRLVEELTFEERSDTTAEDKRCSANGSASATQQRIEALRTDLVPETHNWNNGRGIDLPSWIGCVGSFEHAIGYGTLFWPEFTEFDDCVFFVGFNEQSYHDFLRQTGGNKQAIEAVMNHRHILELFCRPELKPTRGQLLHLGRLLQEMWAAKLHRDFPARRLVISFTDESCADLMDYEITFYQEPR